MIGAGCWDIGDISECIPRGAIVLLDHQVARGIDGHPLDPEVEFVRVGEALGGNDVAGVIELERGGS